MSKPERETEEEICVYAARTPAEYDITTAIYSLPFLERVTLSTESQQVE
jgi:hypothetical protein